MNNYLVSFCVPVYKIDMPRVKRCLNSILRCGLDKDKYEVIIVDDGNTEEYTEKLINLIDEVKKQYIIRHIKHQVNRGLFTARKTAISHATGEYICHVDSDDWLEPNCLIDLENLFTITRPDFIQYQNIMHCINQNNRRWCRFGAGEDIYKKYIFTENESVEQAIIDITTCKYNTPIWGKLIKREIFLKDWDNLPQIDIRTHEDTVWAIHTYPYVKSVCYANIKMYHYDRTNESITSNISKITKQKLERMFTIKYSSDEIIKETERLTNSEEVRRKIREFEMNDIIYYYRLLACDDDDIFNSPETKEYGIKRFEEVFGKEFAKKVKKVYDSHQTSYGICKEEIDIVRGKYSKKHSFKRCWD